MPPTDYLVPDINEMYRFLSSDKPTSQDLTRAASIGCHTLRRLVDDAEFRKNVENSSKALFANKNAVDQAIDDGDHFTGFLKMEKQLMVQAGLEPLLIDELIRQGEQVLRSKRWHGDVKTLFAIIASVRDEACDLARQSEQDQKRKRQIWRIIYAAGGGAFIVVNVAASLISLSPIGVALSSSIGGILIDRAIPDVSP